MNRILAVEDDRIDIMTIQRAFGEVRPDQIIDVVKNGEEALDFLNNNTDKTPSLILLDINMPRMNGIEFLKIIKKDKRYAHIPVLIFTTSKEQTDIVETYNLGIAGYITKPIDYFKFVNTVRTISNYWSLSQLP